MDHSDVGPKLLKFGAAAPWCVCLDASHGRSKDAPIAPDAASHVGGRPTLWLTSSHAVFCCAAAPPIASCAVCNGR